MLNAIVEMDLYQFAWYTDFMFTVSALLYSSVYVYRANFSNCRCPSCFYQTKAEQFIGLLIGEKGDR